MKFVFVCPEQNEIFEADDFEMIENRGIVTDKAGNKALDAKIALFSPCPFCGKRHIFHVSEMMCPFAGNKDFLRW